MRKKLSQKLCIIDFLCIFASLLFLGVLAHLAISIVKCLFTLIGGKTKNVNVSPQASFRYLVKRGASSVNSACQNEESHSSVAIPASYPSRCEVENVGLLRPKR